MSTATNLTSAQPLDVLRRHAHNPSAFLALNDGNSFFRTPQVDGVVPYRAVGRRYWVQFAGPCAPRASRHALWREFRAEARRQNRRVVAVQLLGAEARLAADSGCTVNQLGTSYGLDLSAFTLRGRRFMKTRNMITRSRRDGVLVAEASAADLQEGPLAAELEQLDQQWLRDKGRHVKELQFLVGQRGGRFAGARRLFVARKDTAVVGYVSYSPVFGDHPGWLYDLTRRSPHAPPGVVEHIFTEAGQQLAGEGARWMHLGLTPFVGLDPAHDLPGASRPLGSVVRWIGQKAPWLYPSAGQVAFKMKWHPQLITPEYLAVSGHPRLRDGLCLARATNAL